MKMKHAFDDIIEKDEEIVEVFKPQKTRFWWGIVSSSLMIVVAVLLWSLIVVAGILVDYPEAAPIVALGFLAVIAFVLLLVAIFGKTAYNNRFYAYSNKRILIRSGIIGIDYRTLEFQALTATIVRVSFLDRVLRTNTGTLMFGSPSSPVGMAPANNNVAANSYSFRNIEDPYNTLREIKEYMDSKK